MAIRAPDGANNLKEMILTLTHKIPHYVKDSSQEFCAITSTSTVNGTTNTQP